MHVCIYIYIYIYIYILKVRLVHQHHCHYYYYISFCEMTSLGNVAIASDFVACSASNACDIANCAPSGCPNVTVPTHPVTSNAKYETAAAMGQS